VKKFIFLAAPILRVACSKAPAEERRSPKPNSIDAVVKNLPECDAPRVGDKSREDIFLTRTRYGHDPFFLRPRSKVFNNCLVEPKPYHKANLNPDEQATYWLGTFKLPAGAVLTMHAQYPHGRYFEVALDLQEGNNITATGQALTDVQWQPDPGSKNPYVVGADRLSDKRNLTIRIGGKDAPKSPAKAEPNTLYAGAAGGVVMYVLRIYLPDVGYDGGGWQLINGPGNARGLPTYEATLADGTKLSMEQINSHLIQPWARPRPARTSRSKPRRLESRQCGRNTSIPTQKSPPKTVLPLFSVTQIWSGLRLPGQNAEISEHLRCR